MSDEIKVSSASQDEAEVLVDIMIEALEPDLWSRFMFSEYREESVRLQKEMFLPMMKERFGQLNTCRIVKAKDTKTQKIVGFVVLAWALRVDHEAHVQRLAQDYAAQETFATAFSRDCSARYAQLLGDKPHVVLKSLYISPDYQGRGIGKQLIQYAFENYNLHESIVFIQALQKTSGFYETLGWNEKDATVLDLTTWAGEDTGFGWYRAPQLLRAPGPL